MEGYFEVTYDSCIDKLNYSRVILDGAELEGVGAIEGVLSKAYINHRDRLYRSWNGMFYIENCDVFDVESEEDFNDLLEEGYVVKKLIYADGKLWVEE